MVECIQEQGQVQPQPSTQSVNAQHPARRTVSVQLDTIEAGAIGRACARRPQHRSVLSCTLYAVVHAVPGCDCCGSGQNAPAAWQPTLARVQRHSTARADPPASRSFHTQSLKATSACRSEMPESFSTAFVVFVFVLPIVVTMSGTSSRPLPPKHGPAVTTNFR